MILGLFRLVSSYILRCVSCSVLALALCYSVPVFSNGAGDNPDQQAAHIVVEHWPPWEIADDEKRQQVTRGYAIEIIEELFSRLNIPVEFQHAPWRRALQLIKTGDADLIPMVAENPMRTAYMVFTVPIYRDPVLLAYSLDTYKHFSWQDWADLSGYKIRAVRGYHYGDNWRNAVEKYTLKIGESATDEQNLKMLDQGRIDLTPMMYSNGMSLLEGNDYARIRFAEKPIFTTVLRFGISKQSFLVKRLPEINIHLNTMKRDGTFKRILGALYRPRFRDKY